MSWGCSRETLDDLLATNDASGRTHDPPFTSLDYIATETIDIEQTSRTTNGSPIQHAGG